MTAHSELFFDEMVFDMVRDKLKEMGIKGIYPRGVPEDWKDIWHDEDFPDDGIVECYNEYDEKQRVVAQVYFTVNFTIERTQIGNEKYIQALPTDDLVFTFYEW